MFWLRLGSRLWFHCEFTKLLSSWSDAHITWHEAEIRCVNPNGSHWFPACVSAWHYKTHDLLWPAHQAHINKLALSFEITAQSTLCPPVNVFLLVHVSSDFWICSLCVLLSTQCSAQWLWHVVVAQVPPAYFITVLMFWCHFCFFCFYACLFTPSC